MSSPAFRIAAFTILFILPMVSLIAIQSNGRQSAVLGPLDAREPITYFIADGNGKTGYRSSDRELAQWALQAWQRSAGNSIRLTAAAEPKAVIRLYWAEPSEGEYGETLPIIVDGRRGAAAYVRPDMESLGDDIALRAAADNLLRDGIVYLTCLHELGHALGLEHTRDFRDIMYYFGYGGNVVEYFYRYRSQLHSRKDIAGTSGLSDADVSRIKAMYPSK